MARILIVDDNPTNLRLAASVLELERHQVRHAVDATEALDALARETPDLILMDIALPGTDGLTLTRMIKARPDYAHVPVVALTAFAMKGDEDKALAAGCAGYLTKPLDTRTFGAQVAHYLAAAPRLRRVLIVDDIAGNLRLLRAQLAAEGLEVVEAEHGEQALDRLRQRDDIDGVISDILMPRMDGYRLCLEVRKDARLAELPFILYTSTYNSPADRELAAAAGADAYVSKPAPARDLLQALQAAQRRERPVPRPPQELEAPVLKQYSETLIRKLEEKSAQLGAAYEGLANTEARLSGLVESAMDAIVAIDELGRVLLFNAAAETLFGCMRSEVVGHAVDPLFVEPERLPALLNAVGSRAAISTLRVRRRDGGQFVVEAALSRLETSRGAMTTFFMRDIGERLRAQQALERSESRLRRANHLLAVRTGIANLIVRCTDRDELLRGACRITVDEGFAKAWIGLLDARGRLEYRAGAGGSPEFVAEVQAALADPVHGPQALWFDAMASGGAVVVDDLSTSPRALQSAVASGSRSLAAMPLPGTDGVQGVLVIHAGEVGFFDEEETRQMRELAGEVAYALDHLRNIERIRYLARFDPLTGLPNRASFVEHLDPVLAQAARDEPQGVLLLDLERFRRVNETFGRSAGDALLRAIAGRLARADERVAHVGGDTFALHLKPVRSVAELARGFEEFARECFGEPFRVGQEEVRIGCRGGIALYGSDGEDAETLLRNAEAAARRARQSASHCAFYAPELNARAAEALTLETRLRHAIEQQQFVLHYQPKIDLARRTVVGAEALLRWQDPERGLIPPGLFIPVLEECGLIGEVGEWAAREVLRQQQAWREQGLASPAIAVNVSPLQLREPHFVERLLALLPPSGGLEIEITESVIMEDVDRNIGVLGRLRDAGVGIAVDDFGTGYSSLAYIARLPVKALKIDRSFVTAMTEAPEGHAIVASIIALAHALKLEVVAEGVETEEQARMLRLLGAEQAQGYLFCRPLPAEAFAERLHG